MRDNADEPQSDHFLQPSQAALSALESHANESTAPTQDTHSSGGALSQQSLTFGLSKATGIAPDPLVGVTIGDVTIDRLLAEGGMGRVYLGTQQRPSRTVAVKFMRHGQAAASLERFRREAEVLGRLAHPGIARVFFTGSFRVGLDDVPFSVMEFVPDADTLVRFCRHHSLSLRERLVLFLQVCEAVAYGHSQGVVHRDLKPGNILVTNEGGQNVPRVSVIDFGIAKMLTADGPEGLTATGEFLGTRQYMSPEQLAGSHEQVDASTDVYALGVVLHELLTGRLPYDLAGRSLAETVRIITRTRPRSLELAEKDASHRQRQSLRHIASRCLEKQPGNRYSSAAELAGDIRKLLDGITIPKQHSPQRFAALLLTAAAALTALGLFTLQPSGAQRLSGLKPFVSQKLTANFTGMPAKRSSPLNWVMVSFSSPVEELDLTSFRLTHNASSVSLSGVTLTRLEPGLWKLEGLASANEQEGDYILTLLAGDDSPSDVNGQTLSEAVSTTWTMPPYQVWRLTPLTNTWQDHLVSMDGIACYSEEDAGTDSFFKPTVNGQEGSIVFRFDSPFPIQFAELTAFTIVWTTGDPFPYDPGARASLDVSGDGVEWTELDTREAGRGGRFFAPRDISAVVAGRNAVWVRARLTGTVEWPIDGLIHSQFMRTNKANLEKANYPFVLQVSAQPRVRAANTAGQDGFVPTRDAANVYSASARKVVPTLLPVENSRSTPTALIGQLPSLASTGRVMLSPDVGKAAVNADIGQLCFIDVHAPEAMQLVSEFRSGSLGAFRDFAWSPDGKTLYAVSHQQAGGLHIIDVSDFSAPSQAGFYKTPDYAHEIVLSPDGNTVFIADGNTGLLALDVQRPDAPTLLGRLNLSTFVQGNTLSSDGRLCFLPCFQDGLVIVDVSDPTGMLRVGHASLPGNAWRITRSPADSIVYVITRGEGFFVVDVSNPAAPRVLAKVTRQANIDRLVISSDHRRMYATVRNEGIWTFDISSPASPRLIGTQRITGRPLDVAVIPSTDTAFVAAIDRGLLAVQLTSAAGAFD